MPLTESTLYFDAAATHRVSGETISRVGESMQSMYGNASSTVNETGRTAARGIKQAESDVRAILGIKAAQLVWTSGATESNQLALLGLCRGTGGDRRHVLVSEIEHPSILATAEHLVATGFDVERIPVESSGRVDPAAVESRLRPTTAVVAMMAVNNETGITQPVDEVAAACRAAGVAFFMDATQAVGRLAPEEFTGKADLMSFSGHKFGGPKGVGILVLDEAIAGKLVAPTPGGTSGLRAGTPNTSGAVGLAAGLVEAYHSWEQTDRHLSNLGQQLSDGLQSIAPDATFNGDRMSAVPGILSISLAGGMEAIDFCRRSGRLAVSTGSACSTGTSTPSHVLRAMGLPMSTIRSSVRYSFDRFTNSADVDAAVDATAQTLKALGIA